MKQITLIAAVLALTFFSNTSFAQDIRLNGFLSVVGDMSDSTSRYDTGINKSLSLIDNTRAGLTMTTGIGNDWDFGLQFIAFGIRDQYNLALEWGLASWRPITNLTLSFGKFRMPLWFVSDHINVGTLYPWITPPEEVYGLNSIRTITGASATYDFEAFGWDVVAIAYGGQSDTDLLALSAEIDALTRGSFGGALTVSNEFLSIRTAYSRSSRIDLNSRSKSVSASGFPGVYTESTFLTPIALGETQFYTIGAEVHWNNIMVMSEWVRVETSNVSFGNHSAAYATVGYLFESLKLMPHITYSRETQNTGTLFPGKSNSLEYALNYNVNEGIIVKGRVKQVRTEGGRGPFQTNPTEQPVSVYSLAIDMVF